MASCKKADKAVVWMSEIKDSKTTFIDETSPSVQM